MNQRRLVVGGIIVDDLSAPTTVLATRRSAPEVLKGLWEFPGGKVEPGESPQEALARELMEELSVHVEVGGELIHPDGVWPISDTYEMRLFFVQITDGEPTLGNAHDELRTLDRAALRSVTWLPSDSQALEQVATALGAPGRQNA